MTEQLISTFIADQMAGTDLREYYVSKAMLRKPMSGSRVIALAKPSRFNYSYSMVLEFRRELSLYPVAASDPIPANVLVEANNTRFNLNTVTGMDSWHAELARRRDSPMVELFDAMSWAEDSKHKGFDWKSTGFTPPELDGASYNALVLTRLISAYLDELGM